MGLLVYSELLPGENGHKKWGFGAQSGKFWWFGHGMRAFRARFLRQMVSIFMIGSVGIKKFRNFVLIV